MSVYIYFCCLQGPEEGIRSAQTRVMVMNHHLGPGNWTWVLLKGRQTSQRLSGLFSPPVLVFQYVRLLNSKLQIGSFVPLCP